MTTINLIQPWVHVLDPIDEDEICKKIELIGRNCYKSEDKITPDSAKRFVKMILEKEHLSLLEHVSISVRIVTDRGVMGELTRHRLASFAIESTRYCNYDKKGFTYIIPPWLPKLEPGVYDETSPDNPELMLYSEEVDWVMSLIQSTSSYNKSLANKWSPEQARSVLPSALKTDIIMTANLREWRYALKLRTQPMCHPQIRQVMNLVLLCFQEKLPLLFSDLEVFKDLMYNEDVKK